MKKAIKFALLFLLVLVIFVGVGAWNLFGPLVKGAQSVEKLDEGLYYMEYKGDDGFAEMMNRGGIKDSKDLSTYVMEFLSKGYYTPPTVNPPETPFGCSTLTARTPEGGMMMGRNFDFSSGTAMILHTIPEHGYESITTFNVDFYGFGENWLPEGFSNQYMALTGLFVGLDGLNEKGFAIAVLMAGDDVETHQATDKPDLTNSAAVRYLLNNAANVDEALDLLRGIDMHSDLGAAQHYAMADASGKSVVVEYVDNQMVVTETPAVTNHYLCEAKHNVGLHEYDHRFDQLCEQYDQTNGVMTQQDLTKAIQSVAQSTNGEFWGTLWTMVMDLKNPSVTYYSRRHFDKPFRFELTRKP